jgi:hypothetical protein
MMSGWNLTWLFIITLQAVGSLSVKTLCSKVRKRVLPKRLITPERGSQKIHRNQKMKRMVKTKVMPVKIKSMARQKRRANGVEKFLAGVKVKVEKNQHPMEKVQGVGGAALFQEIKAQFRLKKKLVREEDHASRDSQMSSFQ